MWDPLQPGDGEDAPMWIQPGMTGSPSRSTRRTCAKSST